MPKKKNLDDFIVKALKLYGDKYDYSESVYKNSSTKIKIICKEHGPFLKTPQKFINAKQGCRECTGYKKWSWERFVKEAGDPHRKSQKRIRHSCVHAQSPENCEHKQKQSAIFGVL